MQSTNYFDPFEKLVLFGRLNRYYQEIAKANFHFTTQTSPYWCFSKILGGIPNGIQCRQSKFLGSYSFEFLYGEVEIHFSFKSSEDPIENLEVFAELAKEEAKSPRANQLIDFFVKTFKGAWLLAKNEP